ncbi:MAG: hypothetical protein RIC95_10760 [Vicingaceae bacterium]
MKLRLVVIFTFLACGSLKAQKENPFKGYLPIREDPEVNFSSPMVDSEPLLFEAEPVLYFNLYNNYDQYDTLFQAEKAEAFYLYYHSHFRMFQGRSKPVRMPSYKLFMGYQRSVDIGNGSLSIALESGHYSNGQSGCAWSDTVVDGTLDCELITAALGEDEDLSKRLNRVNGNFSTNLSKLRFQYVTPKFRKEKKRVHKFSFDYAYLHAPLFMMFEYQGSSKSDINIIGRHRFEATYEFIRYTDYMLRYSFQQRIRRLAEEHNSIDPWRFETTLSVYPKEWITAFFFTFIYGHDDYNYRIVDSGTQFSVGVRWDLFQLEEFR